MRVHEKFLALLIKESLVSLERAGSEEWFQKHGFKRNVNDLCSELVN